MSEMFHNDKLCSPRPSWGTVAVRRPSPNGWNKKKNKLEQTILLILELAFAENIKCLEFFQTVRRITNCCPWKSPRTCPRGTAPCARKKEDQTWKSSAENWPSRLFLSDVLLKTFLQRLFNDQHLGNERENQTGLNPIQNLMTRLNCGFSYSVSLELNIALIENDVNVSVYCKFYTLLVLILVHLLR